MKYFITSFIFIFFTLSWHETCRAADPTPSTVISEEIEKLELCSRRGLRDIPSLEAALRVINIPSVQENYEGYGMKFTFTTGDMTLTGAHNFTVEQASISVEELTASLSIRIPKLTLISENYNLKGRALFYSLKGNGLMNVTFENATGRLRIRLVANGETTEVKDLTFDFGVTRVRINLANSTWPINTTLNAQAQNILRDYHNDLVNLIQNALKSYLNQHLSKMSPVEVLTIINSVNCLITKEKTAISRS